VNQNCHKARTTFIAALLLTGSAAAPAGAAESAAFQQVTVRFADINLSVPEGAESLYARIRSAARQVCGREDEKGLALVFSRRACIEKAITDAVTHVGNAQLRAVYEAHQGRGQAARIAGLVQR
jgi:UrcA family protein